MWHAGYPKTGHIPATAPSMLYDEKPGDCLRYKNEGQPVEVMQYTGLKDKNGKEIYEGDIVKTDYYSGTPGIQNPLVGVITYDYTCGFRVYGIGEYAGLREKLHPVTEIIGNIYETP